MTDIRIEHDATVRRAIEHLRTGDRAIVLQQLRLSRFKEKYKSDPDALAASLENSWADPGAPATIIVEDARTVLQAADPVVLPDTPQARTVVTMIAHWEIVLHREISAIRGAVDTLSTQVFDFGVVPHVAPDTALLQEAAVSLTAVIRLTLKAGILTEDQIRDVLLAHSGGRRIEFRDDEGRRLIHEPTPFDRLIDGPGDTGRERMRADLIRRARIVRVDGWEHYRHVWSSGETAGVAYLLDDDAMMSELAETATSVLGRWAYNLYGMFVGGEDEAADYPETRAWFAEARDRLGGESE
jgi:hypothetical protein